MNVGAKPQSTHAHSYTIKAATQVSTTLRNRMPSLPITPRREDRSGSRQGRSELGPAPSRRATRPIGNAGSAAGRCRGLSCGIGSQPVGQSVLSPPDPSPARTSEASRNEAGSGKLAKE